MSNMDEDKEIIKTVYTELCNSYRAIDDFRSKLLGLLPLATGGLFFFITNPGSLIDKAEKASALPSDFLQAIGWFGVATTLGLYCYELYGIRKCTSLIYLGKKLEKDLGEIKGQFTKRPDGVLSDYFGDKYKFIGINEPFAAGIIYPAVIAAWTFLALSRTGFATLPSILVFVVMFLLSMLFMRWLVKSEIPQLEKDLGLVKSSDQVAASR